MGSGLRHPSHAVWFFPLRSVSVGPFNSVAQSFSLFRLIVVFPPCATTEKHRPTVVNGSTETEWRRRRAKRACGYHPARFSRKKAFVD
jgi:hypothetical protein